MQDLTKKVKELARKQGADLIGIAGRNCFSRLPGVRPDELLPGAESVVVMASRVNVYVMHYRPSWHSQEHYVGKLAYNMAIVYSIAHMLEDEGYEAFPISYHGIFTPRGAAYREAIKHLKVSKDNEIEGVEEFRKTYFEEVKYLSLIRLAEEAGLGEMGHNMMLVTPEFGPRIGLLAVITDAPLQPDERFNDKVCEREKCQKCVEFCASGALKPYSYNIVKCMISMGNLPPIDVLRKKDEQEIDNFLALLRGTVFPGTGMLVGSSGGGSGGGCGMCMLACPIGRKKYHIKPQKVFGTAIYSNVF